MPPKNSRKADDPEVIIPVTEAEPKDPPAFVLSQVERQAIVQEVVRALATTANTVTTTASTAQDGQGTLPLAVPSFVNTFATPISTILTNATASLASLPALPVGSLSNLHTIPASVPTTVFTSSIVSPSTPQTTHQPFVVGPGSSPVPAKLVAQIVSGKYVELSELIPANLVETENEPQVFLDGRIVLTTASKRTRRKVEDIISWVETFTIYTLVMTNYYPHRWRDLSHYKMLILRTYRQFGGKAWLAYDKAFREHAAAASLSDWSIIETQLYSFYTAGSVPRVSLASGFDDGQPKGSSNSDVLCRSWNRGRCSSRFSSCRFAHKCSACAGRHRIVECPDFFKDKNGSTDRKRRSPSPVHSAERSKAKRH